MPDTSVACLAGPAVPACQVKLRASEDEERIRVRLREIEQQALQAGTLLPAMARFPGLTRKVARFFGRVILYFGRVITNPQRRFNVGAAQALQELFHENQQLNQQLDAVSQELRKKVDSLEMFVAEQGRLIRDLQQRPDAEPGRRPNASSPAAFTVQAPPVAPGDFDALYVLFEQRFRGSREEIMRRQQTYVPLLRDSGIGAEDMPILDLGCGRGEWLELLIAAGMHANGVDSNRYFLEDCRLRGLDVVADDVLRYLQSLPDECLGAVTGFHIIEHLPFPVLLQFLDETVRVLKPGGLALFETPNPENTLVGSCNFWADPTHQHPLFPPTIQFLCEQRGLHKVEIMRGPAERDCDEGLPLLPPDHPLASPVNQLVQLAKRHFLASMDYAVVGRKPARSVIDQRAA